MIKLFKKEKNLNEIDEEEKYHYNTPKKKFSYLHVIRLIAIAIFIYSLIYILMWQNDNAQTTKMMREIYSSVDFTKTISLDTGDGSVADVLDFTNLLKKNKETVAWVKVNGTNIDYPVVAHKDNDYYLNHSFNNTKNSAGWIFLDSSNSKDFTDKNTVIYGHNRKNGAMFSTLENTLNKSWFSKDDNKILTLYTPKKTYHYQVFSVYKIKAETYHSTTDFKDEKDYQKFINKMIKRSKFDFKVDVTTSDKILTLSTCADNKYYRIVLHAKALN